MPESLNLTKWTVKRNKLCSFLKEILGTTRTPPYLTFSETISSLKMMPRCYIHPKKLLLYIKLLTGYCNWRPPLPVIKRVKYCGVWEGGGVLWGAKILQKITASPLFDIKIVKYCGVGAGGGGIGGAKILQKIMAPPLLDIKIKYCGVGALRALKSHKNNGVPLSVIKIVKYGGVWEGR